MIRHAALIVLLAFAGSLTAQIFPKIEKEEVLKRIASGKTEEEEPAETEPDDDPEPARKIDGDKVLARYHELLNGYFEDEHDVQDATTRHTDDLHVSVSEFMEGACLLRLGFYREADRLLRDVRYRVRDKEDIKNPATAKIAGDIEDGAAYYYRAMAVAMQHWADFEDREALEDAWQDAQEEALEVKEDLESLIRRGLIEDGDGWAQSISVWVHEAKDHWVELFRAEENLGKFPGNVNSWLKLVSLTSAEDYKAENDFTPAYLKQRAAIEVIKEFWPEHVYVMSGRADIALGSNHITTGQLDDWELHYIRRPYHTEEARDHIRAARLLIRPYVKALEDMKTE